ncbi:MAG: hypothetical protein LBG91_02805 [Treponema sp.]|jgi:hypothetical protein|nr:hypothetical protein [Treponema sp.]
MKNMRLFLLCGFLSVSAVSLYTQEAPAPAAESADEEMVPGETAPEVDDTDEPGGPASSEKRRLEMEIKTSSLAELAAWCRTLGLSEGGTKADLSARLREYFKISEPVIEINNKQKIISIESSQTTEYFTIEAIDEDYARLSGNVYITLKDGDAEHRIKANDILFNRSRNILTARGNVEYIKESPDSTEIFRGENITVNIDNWSSIFLNGISERKVESDGTSYLFSGDVITRTDEEVTILNNARISNASDKDTFWSLNASKIWLLPGSDFAIFNGILKVGEIPVLYIPFFYLPADEVVFHPVIGFRSREGGFVQTTTYILGRPKANKTDQDSLSRIMGNSSNMEKRREGLFLRSIGKEAKDKNETTLKALVDYYTNLGAYFGLDFTTPKFGVLNALDISMGIGFTRSITPLDTGYTPFAPDYDGSSDWNKSNFFGWPDAPFRYRFKMANSTISGKYGGLSWNFPFYSDPYVDNDFVQNRAEDMNWVHMVEQGAAIDTESGAQTEIQSYQWQLSGNLRPSIPKAAPYISGISVSSITTTISFSKVADKEYEETYRGVAEKPEQPNRYFFAPDRATLFSFSGSIAGTPLNLGAKNQPTAAAVKKETDDPLKDIGVPRSPWTKDDEEASETTDDDKLTPPALVNVRFDLPAAGSVRFSAGYQLSPTGSSELQFRSGEWKAYKDVDWSDQSTLISLGGNGNINFNVNHTNNLFTNSFSVPFNGTLRRIFPNEEAKAYTPASFNGKWWGTSTVSGKTLYIEFSGNSWKCIVKYGTTDGEGWRGTCVFSEDTATLRITGLTYDSTTNVWSTDLSSLNQTVFTVTKSGNVLNFDSDNFFVNSGDKFTSDLIIRAREDQYRQSFFSTTYSNTVTFRALSGNSVFGQSNLQHSFSGTLGKTMFIGTGYDPEWKWQAGTGEKQEKDILGFTSHHLSANIMASIRDKQQSISLSAELPPLDEAISTNAAFRFWISETTANIRFVRPKKINDVENTEWSIEPLTLAETLRFPQNIGSLTYRMTVGDKDTDPKKTREINTVTNITSTLSLWDFRANFSAVRMVQWTFKEDNPSAPDRGGKWELKKNDETGENEEPDLYPKDFSVSYSHRFSDIDLIKNLMKFSFNVSTGLNYDLQKFTSSHFNLTLGFNFIVKDFLNLNFSITSANDVIFRYFKNVPGMEYYTRMYPEGEQNDLFTDLFDSFDFTDDVKRRRSGFKMRSLRLNAVHFLGDWKATFEISTSPWLPPDATKYDFNTSFSFLVEWAPITEVKSNIRYEKKTDKWTAE